MSFYINSFQFSKPVQRSDGQLLADDIMGTNWPVVYLIHGNNELYIGETSDADGRMCQHLDPHGKYIKNRQKLNTVDIIFDTTYNKSAILDIEQSLIRLFKFEIYSKNPEKKSKYFHTLQNGNNGQSRQHNYYRRAHYLQEVENIWSELIKIGLATNNYKDIINDSIFKFSPYSTLSSEQQETCLDILEKIIDTLFDIKSGKKTEFTAIVNGSAGTGKTIILLHMMSFLTEAMNNNQGNVSDDGFDDEENDEDYAIELKTLSRIKKLAVKIRKYYVKYGPIKMAYVAQMTSLRGTIGTVLKGIKGLNAGDAKGPNDIVNVSCKENSIDKYDILFIDEAHRLWRRKNIQNIGSFDNACKKLYGKDIDPNSKTTLDWLIDCSKTRVIIYDKSQTVKESDITSSQFVEAISKLDSTRIERYKLKQQMRCAGGIDFLNYLNDIFNCKKDLQKRVIQDGYDIRIMSTPTDVINNIITRNEQFGLCRTATGYGWQWKKKKYDACNKAFINDVNNNVVANTRAAKVNYFKDNLKEDDGLIVFDGEKYVRNLDYNWIIEGDPREIGCIHTTQGYDLNYVGVLFGPEIDYDEKSGLIVYERKIQDKSINTTLSHLQGQELEEKKQGIKEFVINAYKVMMERGIKGCYIWAYNTGLQNYFKQFFDIDGGARTSEIE